MSVSAGLVSKHFDEYAQNFLSRWDDEKNTSLFAYHHFFYDAAHVAIWAGWTDLLAMLLESWVAIPIAGGYPSPCPFSSNLISMAIRDGHFRSAVLLRKHGAPISDQVEAQIQTILGGHPDRYNLPAEWLSMSRDIWKAIRSPPERALPPHYALYFGYRAKGHTLKSWPPPNLPEWPSTCIVTQVVRRYWALIKRERRQEAVDRVGRNWATVRKWARARSVAMFWWGVLQVRTCASGGAGRAADREAYRVEYES